MGACLSLTGGFATGSAYAAIGNVVYSRYSDVAHQPKRKPMKQGFTNLEHNIQDAIQVAYGGTPKAKYV